MNDKDDVFAIDMGGKSACVITINVSPTLTTTHYGEPAICVPSSTMQEEMVGGYKPYHNRRPSEQDNRLHSSSGGSG